MGRMEVEEGAETDVAKWAMSRSDQVRLGLRRSWNLSENEK